MALRMPLNWLRATVILVAVGSFLSWLHLSNFQVRRPVEQLLSISPSPEENPPPQTPPIAVNTSHYSTELVAFWAKLSKLLVDSDPGCQLPAEPVEALITAFSNIDGLGHFDRQSLVHIPEGDVSSMRLAHAHFVSQLPSPELPPLPYVKGSRGIVTSAVASFMPVLVVSIRMLRRTGSTLPVEVFIEAATVSDLNSAICTTMLPSLNARCMPLEEILSTAPLPGNVSHYQLKAFALIFSTFERVTWLDADNFPVTDPSVLFDQEPMLSSGLVTWPDYWASTASPLFYDIANISSVPDISERASTESGQLFISKETHASTLLLITYYNYYGPSHYYRLLSQGAVGEGDKETFLAAALALNAPFYAVDAYVQAFGHHAHDGFHGVASLQPNPQADYQVRNQLLDAKRRELFVHCQTVKTDAATISTQFRTEIKQRMFGTVEDVVERFGVDLEKQLWDEIVYTACDLEHDFTAWQGKSGICLEAKQVYTSLFEGGTFD